VAAAVAVGCSGDDRPPEAVCQPLEGTVDPFGNSSDGQTFAALLGQVAGEIRQESVSVIVYLDPDASDDDVASTSDAIAEATGEDPEVVSQQQAYEEYVAIFSEDSPELVEAVVPQALPVSLRFSTDDVDSVDSIEERLDDEGLPVYRIVDSSRGTELGLRSVVILGAEGLEALVEQEEDEDVASAARDLVDTDLTDVDPESDALREQLLLLADRADACGLLD
jgi:hypothetical protein